MRVNWRGVFPAATTQFAEDGSVDLAATGRRLEDMTAAGIDRPIMLGSVGENTVLAARERARITALIRRAIETRPVL